MAAWAMLLGCPGEKGGRGADVGPFGTLADRKVAAAALPAKTENVGVNASDKNAAIARIAGGDDDFRPRREGESDLSYGRAYIAGREEVRCLEKANGGKAYENGRKLCCGFFFFSATP